MYVCMPLTSVKSVCQIDFKLGRCIADDLRMCMSAFGAVWTHELFNINKIFCQFSIDLLLLLHEVKERKHGQRHSAIATHIVVKNGILSG